MSVFSTYLHRTSHFARPVRLTKRIADMLALRRQRNALARLDDAALADIGLTKHEAQVEYNRPIWDAPARWRC